MDLYLANLAEFEGYLIVEPRGAPLLTVLDDGGLAVEFPDSHLAVRLTAPDGLATLTAAMDGARHREAEAVIDDAELWPPHG